MFKFQLLCFLGLVVILGCSFSAFSQVKLLSSSSRTIGINNNRSYYKDSHHCVARSAKEKPFLEAVIKGDIGLIEQFLKKGADPNLKDDCSIPIISYAAHISRPDLLKLFIKSGANVNTIDEGFLNKPPLFWVINNFETRDEKKDIYESLQVLISSGADVNLNDDSKRSALISAVLLEEERLVKMLISAGADVNLQDNGERTAYSYAAGNGNKELKKLLTEAGADLTIGVDDYKKQYGENAFFQAAADGRTDVVEAMIAAGTNVNMANASNMTALMRAANNGTNDSTIDSLISAGADVNVKDSAGFTALIWAVVFGKHSLVSKFIAAGADVNAQTLDGKSALDLAGNDQIRTALINAGAKFK